MSLHNDCESCSSFWKMIFIYSKTTLYDGLNEGNLKQIVSLCQKFWFSKVKMFRKNTMTDWQGRTTFLLGGIWCTTFHCDFSTHLSNKLCHPVKWFYPSIIIHQLLVFLTPHQNVWITTELNQHISCNHNNNQ